MGAQVSAWSLPFIFESNYLFRNHFPSKFAEVVHVNSILTNKCAGNNTLPSDRANRSIRDHRQLIAIHVEVASWSKLSAASLAQQGPAALSAFSEAFLCCFFCFAAIHLMRIFSACSLFAFAGPLLFLRNTGFTSSSSVLTVVVGFNMSISFHNFFLQFVMASPWLNHCLQQIFGEISRAFFRTCCQDTCKAS